VIVVPTSMAKKIVDTLSSDTTTFGPSIIGLFVNPIVQSPANQYSDITEATFLGYARSPTVSFSGPVNDPQGNGLMIGGSMVFACTGSGTPQEVYGAFGVGTGAASTTLTFTDVFPTPIPIANAGDYVQYSFALPYPGPVSGLVGGP
jgi:hypothetical protein